MQKRQSTAPYRAQTVAGTAKPISHGGEWPKDDPQRAEMNAKLSKLRDIAHEQFDVFCRTLPANSLSRIEVRTMPYQRFSTVFVDDKAVTTLHFGQAKQEPSFEDVCEAVRRALQLGEDVVDTWRKHDTSQAPERVVKIVRVDGKLRYQRLNGTVAGTLDLETVRKHSTPATPLDVVETLQIVHGDRIKLEDQGQLRSVSVDGVPAVSAGKDWFTCSNDPENEIDYMIDKICKALEKPQLPTARLERLCARYHGNMRVAFASKVTTPNVPGKDLPEAYIQIIFDGEHYENIWDDQNEDQVEGVLKRLDTWLAATAPPLLIGTIVDAQSAAEMAAMRKETLDARLERDRLALELEAVKAERDRAVERVKTVEEHLASVRDVAERSDVFAWWVESAQKTVATLVADVENLKQRVERRWGSGEK